eukprot:g7447.t1
MFEGYDFDDDRRVLQFPKNYYDSFLCLKKDGNADSNSKENAYMIPNTIHFKSLYDQPPVYLFGEVSQSTFKLKSQSSTKSSGTWIGAHLQAGIGGKDGGPSASISGDVGHGWSKNAISKLIQNDGSSRKVAYGAMVMPFFFLNLKLSNEKCRQMLPSTPKILEKISSLEKNSDAILNDWARFFKKHGTHFVSQATLGAEFYYLRSFSSKTKSQIISKSMQKGTKSSYLIGKGQSSSSTSTTTGEGSSSSINVGVATGRPGAISAAGAINHMLNTDPVILHNLLGVTPIYEAPGLTETQRKLVKKNLELYIKRRKDIRTIKRVLKMIYRTVTNLMYQEHDNLSVMDDSASYTTSYCFALIKTALNNIPDINEYYGGSNLEKWLKSHGYEDGIYEDGIDKGLTSAQTTELQNLFNKIKGLDTYIISDDLCNSEYLPFGPDGGAFTKFDNTRLYCTENPKWRSADNYQCAWDGNCRVDTCWPVDGHRTGWTQPQQQRECERSCCKYAVGFYNTCT